MKDATPKLAPPGAGVPLTQRLLMRLWIGPFVSKRAKRPDVRTSYEVLVEKMIRLVESVPADRRSVRILVPSQPGLEDSSRYWSLNGVLEHLMIVSRSAEEIILSLASGNIPSGKADTAAVKPTGRDGDRLAEYREYAPGCLAHIDARLSEPGMNADSLLTFRHPWFGEITAHQWYWLSATHLAIHYRQSKAIVKGL